MNMTDISVTGERGAIRSPAPARAARQEKDVGQKEQSVHAAEQSEAKVAKPVPNPPATEKTIAGDLPLVDIEPVADEKPKRAPSPADERAAIERPAPDAEAPRPDTLGSSWARDRTAYDYEVTKEKDLVVKVVDKEDRTKVLRQYPSEESLAARNAFRRFMERLGR